MEETVESLRTKLADREERLKRAWAALGLIQAVLQKRTSPGAFEPPDKKSLEAFGQILADGAEDEISKRDAKFLNLITAGRRVHTWIGRAPANEKEAKEMNAIKRTFDLALMGVIEGEAFHSFYVPDDQVIEASPACDSPTTQSPALSHPPESGS